MAHFRTELRQQLRDDLMQTIGNGLRDNLVRQMQRALQDVLADMVETHVFEAVDKMLDQFFADEDMDCWLSFAKDGPRVLVGIGPGDCAAQFEPTVTISDYRECKELSREQQLDVVDQITGIKKFMTELDLKVAALEDALEPYLGNVTPFPLAPPLTPP